MLLRLITNSILTLGLALASPLQTLHIPSDVLKEQSSDLPHIEASVEQMLDCIQVQHGDIGIVAREVRWFASNGGQYEDLQQVMYAIRRHALVMGNHWWSVPSYLSYEDSLRVSGPYISVMHDLENVYEDIIKQQSVLFDMTPGPVCQFLNMVRIELDAQRRFSGLVEKSIYDCEADQEKKNCNFSQELVEADAKTLGLMSEVHDWDQGSCGNIVFEEVISKEM